MPRDFKLNRSHGTSEQRAITVSASAETAEIREEELMGVNHLVVPIIALVEGVLHASNASNPELALASEFGRFAVSWNGRPITLGHPIRDGSNVSAASTPKIFEEETLGFIFNARVEDNKLKVEAWINMETLENASDDVKDEIKRLQEGEVVEVSTGLFTLVEKHSGRFAGKQYEGIWRDVVPDHLAILHKGVQGACSVADGCGTNRTNHAHDDCHCGGECDPCKTDRSSAMPKDKKDKKDAAEDEIKDSQELTEEQKANKEKVTFLSSIGSVFKGFFKNNKGLSDTDTRQALQAAVKAESDNAGDHYCYIDIVAVFDKQFVYCKNWEFPLVQRDYKIADTGVITLGGEIVQVRPVTEFVPITIKESNNMSKKEVIDGLIANAATQFTEEDRTWLETLEEPVLNRMAPVTKEPTVNAAPTPQTPAAPAEAPKALSATEYLEAAPAEVRAVLNQGLKLHNERKAKLIEGLKANDKNAFSDAELNSMEISQLEKLAALARVPSFEGQAGGAAPVVNEGANTPAPKVFEAKKA